MVTHVVIFTWRDGVASDVIERLAAALQAMAHEVRHLADIRQGPDLRFRDGNGDYGLVATFADHAAWLAYQQHPAHKAFVRDHVTPIQAHRRTIQF